MLKIDVYTKSHMKHHVPRCDDFLHGIRVEGDLIDVRYCDGDHPVPASERGDVALFWSGYFPNVIDAYDDFLLMEGARWAGDDTEAVTVGWNGFHHGATYFANDLDPSRRHISKLALQPWRDNPDGYALIFGQVQGDFAARDWDLQFFYQQAAAFYENRDVKVRFRPHPHSPVDDGPVGVERSTEPLADALAGARLTVSCTTTAACDAIAAGVPGVTQGSESMAWDVSAHQLTLNPPKPCRERWMNYLGQTEWTWTEVRDGVAWRQLREKLNENSKAA